MPAFQAMLYGGTLPTSGVACTARFAGSYLQVDGAHHQSIAATDIHTSVGGFDDTSLFLNWQAGGQRYALSPVDAAARATLSATAPPELQKNLKRSKRQSFSQSWVWYGALTMIGLVALGLVFAYFQTERLTHWLAEKVPVETEVRLGEATLSQVKAEGDLVDSGKALEMVKDIGGRLTKGSRYEYQWFLKDDPSINAFAVPGGIVVVHTGLIARASSPEEVAGVLAHEVQHIELRHSLQNMIHAAGWAAILAVTLGDVTAITGVLLHQAGNLRHSRRLESEADARGLQALARAKIPLGGMEAFFGKLAEENKDSDTFALLSSHPATTERLANIRKLAKATPCMGCAPLAINWAAIQADPALAKAQKEAKAEAEKKAKREKAKPQPAAPAPEAR